MERHQSAGRLSAAKTERLMEFLATIKLTKLEKLQMVNMLPETEVVFYLVPLHHSSFPWSLIFYAYYSQVVEECEERFTSEQVRDIIAQIGSIVNSPITN